MRAVAMFAMAVALVASAASAEDLKSGLQAGQAIGAFNVVKFSGADSDGVKVGAELCYRCKYGGRPMVMVFTRSSDESIAALSQQLNEAVSKNSEKKLSAFVNLVGEKRDALEATAKEFGTKNKLANVPVVVPTEFENGPGDYGINEKAEVTVLLAVGGKVKANHAFAKGAFNKDAVKKVVDDLSKILE